jgi:hypothetical protein
MANDTKKGEHPHEHDDKAGQPVKTPQQEMPGTEQPGKQGEQPAPSGR